MDGAETEQADGTKKPQRGRSAKLFVRDVLLILLAAIVISFVIKTFLIRSFYIPSGSMMNTLQIHDRIIVNELEPNVVPIKHGDVVVFTDPGGWLGAEPGTTTSSNPIQSAIGGALTVIGLSASDSDDHLIKRVIGLPGDHVTCCGNFGDIRVNGVPLDEPYIHIPTGQTNADAFTYDVTVPKGDLWVLGDNRYESADSAYHHNLNDPDGGFVPIKDVVGRAFLISWPFSHWSVLSNYPVTFRGVDDGAK